MTGTSCLDDLDFFWSGSAKFQLRIVAKFKLIRDLAPQDGDVAEAWTAASEIRQVAKEIQDLVTANPHECHSGLQDLGPSWDGGPLS